MLHGPQSKLLVSPLISPIVVTYITPFKEFRLQLIWTPCFQGLRRLLALGLECFQDARGDTIYGHASEDLGSIW